MVMKAKTLLLVLGILIGLAAATLMPRFWQRLVPQRWKTAPTEGVVEEKRWEEDRLLLTLVTSDGAVLATFTQRVSEIDLLVVPGDTVSLSLDGYRPFVEDPEIVRVIKARAGQEISEPPAALSPEGGPTLPEADESGRAASLPEEGASPTS